LPTSRVITAGNHREALDYLDSLHLTGSFILVKGSRGMRMETIANELLS
jgi:UDP-N-acetylmuramyl pentapeptide synthase